MHIIDVEPLRALAKRAAAKIGDAKVGARFEQFAFARLLSEPSNFRPARADEVAKGAEWAQRAAARGETVLAVARLQSASCKLHVVARRLALACCMAETDASKRPRYAGQIAAARQFLDTIDRASFDVLAQKARRFARQFAGWEDERDKELIWPEQRVNASNRRVWRRVRSLAELRTTGHEFVNCLARLARSSSYARTLLSGVGQFWVLRDEHGKGLILALTFGPPAGGFLEVRGPRNAIIADDDPDLARLSLALSGTFPPPYGGACAHRRTAPQLNPVDALLPPAYAPRRLRRRAAAS